MRLESAAEAAARQIKDRLEEELEDSAQRALGSVLKLHALFIATDAVGIELLNAAARYNREPKDDSKIAGVAEPIVDRLASAERSMVEATAALKEALVQLQDPRRPERTGFAGFAFINSALAYVFNAAVTGVIGNVATTILSQDPQVQQLIQVTPQFAQMASDFILEQAPGLHNIAALFPSGFGWITPAIEWLRAKTGRH